MDFDPWGDFALSLDLVFGVDEELLLGEVPEEDPGLFPEEFPDFCEFEDFESTDLETLPDLPELPDSRETSALRSQ